MKYQGILAQPITARRPRTASRAAAGAEMERITAERMAKLRLLAEVHGVEEDDWLALALALAVTHVPGFGIVSEPNGHGGWTELEKAELRLEVDALRAATGKALDAAIQAVVRAERWRVRSRHLSASALRQQYHQAQSEWLHYAELAHRSWHTANTADAADDD